MYADRERSSLCRGRSRFWITGNTFIGNYMNRAIAITRTAGDIQSDVYSTQWGIGKKCPMASLNHVVWMIERRKRGEPPDDYHTNERGELR